MCCWVLFSRSKQSHLQSPGEEYYTGLFVTTMLLTLGSHRWLFWSLFMNEWSNGAPRYPSAKMTCSTFTFPPVPLVSTLGQNLPVLWHLLMFYLFIFVLSLCLNNASNVSLLIYVSSGVGFSWHTPVREATWRQLITTLTFASRPTPRWPSATSETCLASNLTTTWWDLNPSEA